MRVARTPWRENPRPLPDGHMAVGVGDVHGCAGHLEAMYRALAEDVARLEPERAVCVLLGDLIDRGPDSLDCLGLAAGGLAAFAPGRPVEDVALAGNHDDWLIRAVDGTLTGPEARMWLDNGGGATLRSLGLRGGWRDAAALSAAVRERLAGPARGLLSRMAASHRVGDLLFVHAGIDPRRPLHRQTREAMLWIRDAFLRPPAWPFEVLAVHGHTIELPDGEPVVHPHRIGVDTGAVLTGVLTAAEFHGDRLRFVTVTGR